MTKNLHGRRFGKLRVSHHDTGKGWLCFCDCGGAVYRTRYRLTHDVKKASCGCSRFSGLHAARAPSPTMAKIERMKKLRARGESTLTIAKAVGVGVDTVRKHAPSPRKRIRRRA